MRGAPLNGPLLRSLTAAGLLLGALLAAALLMSSGAGAATTAITECAGETQLRADVSAGGSYTFACSGTIVLSSPLFVTHAVSLTAAAPDVVAIRGYPEKSTPPPGAAERIITVAAGGSLELSGVDLTGGRVSTAPVETPGAGQTPENGCLPSGFGWKGGDCATPGAKTTNAGENGFDATGLATNGGNAPAGGSAQGGCILIEPGAKVWLENDALSECVTEGSSDKWLTGTGPGPEGEGVPGYKQGIGGFGGDGAGGSAGEGGGKQVEGVGASELCTHAPKEAETAGGTGGNGNAGADGGNGSAGGGAFGGAIYDAGSLVVTHTLFQGDRAFGGQGGAGGNGGNGGVGGAGGEGGLKRVVEDCATETESAEPGAPGGNGSIGGDGGNGGVGGAGAGGAIYATGYLTIAESSFKADSARGGNGGTAGLGGAGGQGGNGGASGNLHGGSGTKSISGGAGGSSGEGGSAGDSGNGGNGSGGAVFYATGSTGALPDVATTFGEDLVLAGGICAGLGSTAEVCGTAAGPAGHPGLGGESTPCAEPQSQKGCPLAREGTKGGSGAAGVIGIAGSTEGNDVAGVPGTGTPPSRPGPGPSTGPGSPQGSTGTGTPPTPHAGHASARGTSVIVAISCAGSAGSSCPVTAAITVQETINGAGKLVALGARAKLRHRVLTLGTVTVRVPAGSTRKVTIGLSPAGRRLLASKRRLAVRLTLTQLVAANASARARPVVIEQTDLTLRAPRKH